MTKLFAHFLTKAAFEAATKGTDYSSNSIVFIKDSLEIWTHDAFYAIPDSYKNKITNLETAVNALLEALAANFAFRKVSDGTNIFTTSNNKEILTFEGGANTSVKVDPTDGKVTIASTLTPNSYFPYTSGTELKEKVDTLEASLYTVEGSNVITVTGEDTKVIDIKLDSTGNVTLTKGEDGLKAHISDVSAIAPVQGVATTDSVLNLNSDKKLTATLKLKYDTAKKKVQLLGIGDAVVSEIDASDFIKDGMLSDALFDEATHILTLTFNTDAGKEAIDVDLSKLVDTYDGSNLKLKSVAIPSEDAVEPSANDTLDSAIANLVKRDRELKAELDKINTDIGDVQSGGLVGVDGSTGKYVSINVSEKASNRQTISAEVKTDVAIASASSASDGLATANAVKTYVEDMLAWAEFD